MAAGLHEKKKSIRTIFLAILGEECFPRSKVNSTSNSVLWPKGLAVVGLANIMSRVNIAIVTMITP